MFYLWGQIRLSNLHNLQTQPFQYYLLFKRTCQIWVSKLAISFVEFKPFSQNYLYHFIWVFDHFVLDFFVNFWTTFFLNFFTTTITTPTITANTTTTVTHRHHQHHHPGDFLIQQLTYITISVMVKFCLANLKLGLWKSIFKVQSQSCRKWSIIEIKNYFQNMFCFSDSLYG